jgi:hypothetical protein
MFSYSLALLLEVKLKTKYVCSWAWVKVVVDTSVNLRIETVILCECSYILYGCEDIEAELAVVNTLIEVRECISEGDVVNLEE